MEFNNLLRLLKTAAESSNDKGITIYHPNTDDNLSTKISYAELYEQVSIKAKHLAESGEISTNEIVILHVDNHLDGILWFWVCIYSISFFVRLDGHEPN